MKLLLSWLREFVPDAPAAAELSHRLSVAGLEVEAIDRIHPPFRGVKVARVLDVYRHPNADRLNLCEVDAGAHGRFRVVCGAPNVRPGMIAPLALVGARLGGGKPDADLDSLQPLEAAVIRGERSQGMLCSGRELGLSEDHSGILELGAGAPVGDDLGEHLQLEDEVLDIAITPNRGDCLSVKGLAREVAALFELKFAPPRLRAPNSASGEPPSIDIEAPQRCQRYAALTMEGIRVGPSPALIRRRLELSGMRGVSNVVDITNYVMLELGQPLHAFDLHKLAGGRIVVREAGDERSFVTLDGTARELEPTDLVIADRDKAVAIAGVMGGESSEVSDTTTAILLESAYFEPIGVARTGRRLGLRSEASYRFERGVDRAGQVAALWRAAELVRRYADGRESAPLADVEPLAEPARQIELDLARMAALLGTNVARAQVRRRLISLGAKVAGLSRGRMLVTAPSFRPDLREPADLAEEVARMSGLEEIPARLPARPAAIAPVSRQRELSALAKALLVGRGLTEIRTVALNAPADNRQFPGMSDNPPVVIANPLSAELSELRKSLLPGLLGALRFNLNRQARAFHPFELAKVFEQSADGPLESFRLAAIHYGAFVSSGVGKPVVGADFELAKGVMESLLAAVGCRDGAEFLPPSQSTAPYLHPGKSAAVRIDGELLGFVGELHPEQSLRLDLSSPCALFEIDFSRLVARNVSAAAIKPPPRFPAIGRDLAIVLDLGTPAATVIRTIRELSVPWLESVEVFDVYTGEGVPAGKKSLAMALRYRAAERTLTDEEVNGAHDNLVRSALQRLDAQLR